MFIYPENLKAKPMLWLWLLRDIAVIGIGALLSVLALTQGLGMGLAEPVRCLAIHPAGCILVMYPETDVSLSAGRR